MSEEQDNGQKTEVQLTQERLERYQKDPHSFVELSEIIVCVIRSDDAGPMAYIKGNKVELQIAYAELNQRIMQTISKMEMEAAMKNKGLLHKPGGFLSGLRGMGKRR